jgi:hypothetical protein
MGEEVMRSREYRARVAALTVLQAGACARLLRAHGRGPHADNLEAAVNEVTEILARHLGSRTLTAAMDWASDQLWAHAEAEAGPPATERVH